MTTPRKIQISITIASILIIGAHVIWPSLKIDAITLTLIIVAIIPWLAPLFKSLELPGGLKFEFQELKRVEKEAKAAGLVTDEPVKAKQKYIFMELADSNPQLALAGLRIELEKSLKALAEQHRAEGYVESKHTSISRIMRDLYEKQILSHQENAALADMIGTLNRAVHGEELDHRATQWVIDIGPQVLDGINRKLMAKNIS